MMLFALFCTKKGLQKNFQSFHSPILAERVGFDPTEPCDSTDFECFINRGN